MNRQKMSEVVSIPQSPHMCFLVWFIVIENIYPYSDLPLIYDSRARAIPLPDVADGLVFGQRINANQISIYFCRLESLPVLSVRKCRREFDHRNWSILNAFMNPFTHKRMIKRGNSLFVSISFPFGRKTTTTTEKWKESQHINII